MMTEKDIKNANSYGITLLIANMIILAFDDLYHGNDYNRASARRFFESPLFKATGLNFEYLNRKYLEGAFKKNVNVFLKGDME